jgi:feruloyl esterase
MKGLIHAAYLDNLFGHMIYGLTNVSSVNFDFDHDYQRLGLAAIYTDTNPDLRRLKVAGAKLLMYQGASDTLEMPTAAVDFYESVERLIGNAKDTATFFRLFMVPAMSHCGGGEGAYMIDYLSAMEAWVEHATPPDKLIGAHPSDDFLAAQPLPEDPSSAFIAKLTREDRIRIAAGQLQFPLDPSLPISFLRPIYPYPLIAKYRGRGNRNDASSFVPIGSSH